MKRRLHVACIVLSLLNACGAGPRAEGATPTTASAVNIPPAAAVSAPARTPAGPSSVKPEELALLITALEHHPERLREMIEPSRGLAIARSLGCEREDSIEVFRLACGAAIDEQLPAVLPVLSHRISQTQYPDHSVVVCDDMPEPRCQIPPSNECESAFTLIFSDTASPPRLVALIERDDWQSSEEYRTATDQRIAELLERSKSGCAFHQ